MRQIRRLAKRRRQVQVGGNGKSMNTPPFDYTRFYDAIAPAYGLGQMLLPVWRGYTESVLPWLPTQGRTLEIGPGPGVLLTKLARRSQLAVGLDLSAGMLRECR